MKFWNFIEFLKFWKYLELSRLRPPELICFDHLYSEYLAMKPDIKESDVKFIDDLFAKVKAEDADNEKAMEEGVRGKRPRPKSTHLSWDELYYFELVLAEVMPAENLRSKIVRLRSDYGSIATEKEFAEYLGSKPRDLHDPPDAEDPPDGDPKHIEKLMRTDLKDLLGRIYFKYSILPVREERLTDLAWFAARLCLFSLIILLVILAGLFIAPLIYDIWTAPVNEKFGILTNSERLASLTVFVVVVCGAMGGFVSALQRIQSPPTEGDSLYNLSLLFHGSKSVFIAPITGAIFAIILYLMFAAGILQGTFFPAIFTPGSRFDLATARANARRSSETNANTGNANAAKSSPTPQSDSNSTGKPPPTAGSTNTSGVGNSNSNDQPAGANVNSGTPNTNKVNNSNTGNSSAGNSVSKMTPTPTPTPTSTPTPTPTPDEAQAKKTEAENAREPTKGLNVFDFLARSGPGTGKDYALLIIWCFIAGFAERFVPDALDRVISNSKTEKKK
jgi:hypothetical protein